MTEQFRDAIRRAGLGDAGPIYADGRLHRFNTAGDKARNSWYLLHLGPPAAGAFGCWKRGFTEKWWEKSRHDFTESEWRNITESSKRADAERERAEKERQEKARKTAAWILGKAGSPNTNAYLVRKGVQFYGKLRQWRGSLVVPLCDVTGQLHSLQFIGAEGTKRFLRGGRIACCFFTIGDMPDGPLVIVEGYATGASVHEATGFATICAMDCHNLKAVAEAMRIKWPERQIIIASDNDAFSLNKKKEPWNPGVESATTATLAIGARLAVPVFADVTMRPTDFNDLHQLEGLAIVKEQIENAAVPTETDDELFHRLAKLTFAEYDRVRESEAERAGVRVGTLDSEVATRRPKGQTKDASQGSKVSFPELDQWPHPVDGAALLNEIALTVKRFVIAPEPAITAASLFAVHTYAFDFGDISPILFITGPTKRCGKSKFLAVLLRLVSRPFAAASATAAGIYRIIELHHPTLCIDEVDAFVRGDEQLRGLINSGHTRDAAFHLGCAAAGDKEFEPRRWSTWTPKIFSGIGRLADTIEDRALVIEMVRRRKDEPCERLRHRTRFDDIRRKALRFVNDHAEAIRNGNPSLPEALHDRAADNWTPLLVLADLAGADWPEKARQAALALSEGDDGVSLGLNGQLLADIRDVFAAARADKLASKDMAERLAQIEGRPWAEYGKQRRPISTNQLANLLRGFGVSPRTVRIGNGTSKGYDAAAFIDAFSRYLPGHGLVKGNSVTSVVNIGESRDSQKVTTQECDGSENVVSVNKSEGCDVVTFQSAEKEEMLI